MFPVLRAERIIVLLMGNLSVLPHCLVQPFIYVNRDLWVLVLYRELYPSVHSLLILLRLWLLGIFPRFLGPFDIAPHFCGCILPQVLSLRARPVYFPPQSQNQPFLRGALAASTGGAVRPQALHSLLGATGVSWLLDPLSWQSKEVCVHYLCAYTYLCVFPEVTTCVSIRVNVSSR